MIRPYSPSDLSQLASIVVVRMNEYFSPDSNEDYAQDQCLVLELGQMICGFVQFKNELAVGRILDVYVVPERRRVGHGTELLEQAESRLREMSCREVKVHVFGRIHQQHVFFLRKGYSWDSDRLLDPDEPWTMSMPL